MADMSLKEKLKLMQKGMGVQPEPVEQPEDPGMFAMLLQAMKSPPQPVVQATPEPMPTPELKDSAANFFKTMQRR